MALATELVLIGRLIGWLIEGWECLRNG